MNYPLGQNDPAQNAFNPTSLNWGGGVQQPGAGFSLGNITSATNPTGAGFQSDPGLTPGQQNQAFSGFDGFAADGSAIMTDPSNLGSGGAFDWGNLAGQAAPILSAGASLFGAWNNAQHNKLIEKQIQQTQSNWREQYDYSKGLNDKRVARHDRIRSAYNNS